MTRLIDADALIDAYCNGCTHYRGKICRSAQRCDFESFCNEYINTMPTVDAVPVKRGKWTVTPIYIKCSECGESFMLMPQNYCPNCGCRMDEK